ALDSLGYAIESDDCFFVLVLSLIVTIKLSHVLPPPDLKLKAALASALSEFLHAAVVQITAAVKYDILDALCLAALSHQQANLLRGVLVAAVLGEVLLDRRSGDEGHAGYVVDHLCIDVLCASVNVKTGALCGAGDLAAHSLMALQARLVRILLRNHLSTLSF